MLDIYSKPPEKRNCAALWVEFKDTILSAACPRQWEASDFPEWAGSRSGAKLLECRVLICRITFMSSPTNMEPTGAADVLADG